MTQTPKIIAFRPRLSFCFMNTFKFKYHVKLARIVRADDGTCTFGGDSTHAGAHPKGWKQSLHLIATLAASDAAFPLEDYPFTVLPLYYPFASDFPLLQYRVKSNDSIEIVHVSDYQSADSPMIETTYLPFFRGNLVPFGYEEVRAIALSEYFPTWALDHSDQKLIDSSLAFSSVMIGNNLRTFQGDLDHDCRNADCKAHGKQSRLNVFCIVPCSRDLAPDDHWGAYTDDVDLVFGTCRFCDTIVATNVCT